MAAWLHFLLPRCLDVGWHAPMMALALPRSGAHANPAPSSAAHALRPRCSSTWHHASHALVLRTAGNSELQGAVTGPGLGASSSRAAQTTEEGEQESRAAAAAWAARQGRAASSPRLFGHIEIDVRRHGVAHNLLGVLHGAARQERGRGVLLAAPAAALELGEGKQRRLQTGACAAIPSRPLLPRPARRSAPRRQGSSPQPPEAKEWGEAGRGSTG